ncbi:MAG TPA: IucA/IucC family protein [Victivallales bacterium]|nr:IucA/IucC family protein [Victivallales bacterium]
MCASFDFNDTQCMKNWLYFENHKNGIRPRANNPLATFSEFPSIYRPGSPAYNIPFFKVPRTNCLLYYSNSADEALKNYFFKDDSVHFPVHPVNLENSSIPHIEEFLKFPVLKLSKVHPTSSTRTVFIMNDDLPPHCIKGHTDLKITRWRRHMEMRKVIQAIAVTSSFEQAAVFQNYSKVAYYPESIGVVYGGKKKKDWGFIVREMRAKPHIEYPYKMIPLCSFYVRNDNETTLLEELLEKSGIPPKKFILEEILYPLLTGWIKIYMNTGILLEPHGQNIILELNEETNQILRFAHRDFDCETNIDLANENGFNTDLLNPKDLFTTKGREDLPQGSRVSILFDNSVKVPLEAIVKLANEVYKIPQKEIRNDVKTYLFDNFPIFMKKHLPPSCTAYNYKDTRKGRKVISYENTSGWR